MSRATSDVVDALAPRPTEPEPVAAEEVQNLDVGPQTHIRAIGNPRKVIARSATGGVVMGGDVVRCSHASARRLCADMLTALPCHPDGRVIVDRRPAYARGLPFMDTHEASRMTGEDLTRPKHGATDGVVVDYVAPDETGEATMVVRLADVHLTGLDGTQYGPGAVLRGRAYVLAPYVARGRAHTVTVRPWAHVPVVVGGLAPAAGVDVQTGARCSSSILVHGRAPPRPPAAAWNGAGGLTLVPSIANHKRAQDDWRMVEKLPDVWASRDFPVLCEVARRIDAGDPTPTVAGVVASTGLTEEQVSQAAHALERRGFLGFLGAGGGAVLRFKDLSGEAYLLTGLHPNGDEAVSQLMSAIDQAVEQVDDPAEKPRLRVLRDAVGGVSRDVLSGVIAAVITSQTGMGT